VVCASPPGESFAMSSDSLTSVSETGVVQFEIPPAKRFRSGSMSDTVLFNVGGRLFEVLRSPTLTSHPDSLLRQLAEAHEDDGGGGGGSAIFVEANPELFSYMLDYHRNGKIYIPLSISKQAVLHEAEKLGLPIKEDSIVQDVAPLGLIRRCTERALKDESAQVESTLKSSRMSFLGALVIKRLLQKVGQNCNSASITVNSEELEIDEIRTGSRLMGEMFSLKKEKKVMTFEQTMQFLTVDLKADELSQHLAAWCEPHNFSVKVKMGSTTSGLDYFYNPFVCTFS